MSSNDYIPYIALGGLLIGSVSFLWNIWAWRHKDKMSSEQKYKDHIKPLLMYFGNFMKQDVYLKNDIETIFTFDSLMSKKILQHMYSFDKTKILYEMVKDTAKGKDVSPIDFKAKFFSIWNDLITSPFPDFGACEECLKKIKIKEVKRCKKILKDADPKMWDLF